MRLSLLCVDDVCMIVVMADCPHTIGVEFGTRIIEVSGQKIKLQIWDTAGRYPSHFIFILTQRCERLPFQWAT